MWRFARLKIWLLIAAVLDPEKDDTITCTFCVERTRKESNKDTGGPPVFQAPCFRMTLARMPTPIVWMFNICNLTIVLHWQQRLSMFTQPRNFFHRSLGWTWGWKVAQCVLTIARISGAVRQGLLRVCKRRDRALSFTFTNLSLMKALVLSVDQPWRSCAYGPWNVICMGFLHCDSFARQDQRHAIFADFVALELLPKDLPSWNMPCFSCFQANSYDCKADGFVFFTGWWRRIDSYVTFAGHWR